MQEKHSPTVPVTVRASAERHDYACQRRLLDARLWDSLPREAQDAAVDIAFAYEALTKGMGATTSNWSRVPGARNPAAVANAHGRLTGRYMDWASACTREGISHSMIIDIVCMGFSCSALDRDRRVRKGTSRTCTSACAGEVTWLKSGRGASSAVCRSMLVASVFCTA